MTKGYDPLGLYHNADDPRVIVAKRVTALGWTTNVGHQKGRMALAAVGVVIAAALQYGLKSGRSGDILTAVFEV